MMPPSIGNQVWPELISDKNDFLGSEQFDKASGPKKAIKG